MQTPDSGEEEKSQTTNEKDVDALTFMRTVLMSFVGGMEYGEQTLPTMTVAMEQQGFTPAEVKGSFGYRPKEEDAEDNPLLVVGVHTKDIVHDRYPRPDTSWAERAYFSGALDPSLHGSRKCYCDSVADLWATCCHGPHRMASAFSPPDVDQSP